MAEAKAAKGDGDSRPNADREAEPKSRRPAAPGRDVGDALRTVYDNTVSEAIPPEMLALLGKLD